MDNHTMCMDGMFSNPLEDSRKRILVSAEDSGFIFQHSP
jgi:hypothetical protein